ncbi:putative MFS family arabinose efflux permease [Nocardiopsis mwathae]|uniref:Putative MFS family arabinose efflux permease n=1 Tax=Nocardiopsis mwathae TaxID=1472723 RepID=A0A7W9YEL5_9ACTN|nr:hypothetical protein [Nocardiopsis mwathae]MBB6170753.1 putative MFS family arabinose efflux permease [Nocardiopsis mwathae]
MLMGLALGAAYLGDAVGSMLAGVLVEAIGARGTFATAAAIILACGLLTLRRRS